MHSFDILTKKPTPFSCRPKTHLLHHLKDDLLQFGCALRYETEKGEQFNKFLREHLFHTNRMSTSRDLALKFGKQDTMRHITDGGSWVSKRNRRVKCGPGLDRLVSSVGDDFFEEMFAESRQFADNNYTGIKSISKGICGVFECMVGSVTRTFVGEVVEVHAEGGIKLNTYSLSKEDGNLLHIYLINPLSFGLHHYSVKTNSIISS